MTVTVAVHKVAADLLRSFVGIDLSMEYMKEHALERVDMARLPF